MVLACSACITVLAGGCKNSSGERNADREARREAQRADEVAAARALSDRLSAVLDGLPGKIEDDYGVGADKQCADDALQPTADDSGHEVIVVYVGDLQRAVGGATASGDGDDPDAQWSTLGFRHFDGLEPVTDEPAFEWSDLGATLDKRPFLAVWRPVRYFGGNLSDVVLAGHEGSPDYTRGFDPGSATGALIIADARSGTALCWAWLDVENSERVAVYDDDSLRRDLHDNLRAAMTAGLERISTTLRPPRGGSFAY